MPTANDVPILGSTGYQPTAADKQRLSTFLNWLPADKKPSSVVLIAPNRFANVAKQFTGPDEHTGIAFSVGDRTYLDAAALNPTAEYTNRVVSQLSIPSNFRPARETYADVDAHNLAEFALAHEIGHMNSKLSLQDQERVDYLQNLYANNQVGQYDDKQGRAYQKLQQRVASDEGTFQPTPAPITTTLQPDYPMLGAQQHAIGLLHLMKGFGAGR